MKKWFLAVSDLVNKVAELLNAPVDLVQRSAEARAQASGVSVDDVLNSWAGGESVAASSAPAPKEEAPVCLLYTSPSPRDDQTSRMPSSA